MRRQALAILLAAMLLLACGACKKAPVQASEGAAQPAKASGSAPDAAPATQRELLDWLAGDWTLLTGGDLLGGDLPVLTLTFESGRQNLYFTLGDTPEHAGAAFTFETLFERIGTDDLLHLEIDEVTEDVSQDADTLLGTTCDLQLLTARVADTDVLALREIGNDDSLLAMVLLGYERMAGDSFWVFARVTQEKPTPPDEAQYDAIRKKGETFYAVRWLDFGDICYLQALDAAAYEEDWYGEMLPAVCYALSADENALVATMYPVPGGADDTGAPPPRAYLPALVRVTTDEDGAVVAQEDLPYLGYGIYLQEEMNGAGSDERDPAVYAETDAAFLGKWVCASPKAQLIVSEAGAQTGGYALTLSMGFADVAQAYANIDGEGLSINQGSIMERYGFGGTLRQTANGILFTVTESEFGPITAGTSWELTRAAG